MLCRIRRVYLYVIVRDWAPLWTSLCLVTLSRRSSSQSLFKFPIICCWPQTLCGAVCMLCSRTCQMVVEEFCEGHRHRGLVTLSRLYIFFIVLFFSAQSQRLPLWNCNCTNPWLALQVVYFTVIQLPVGQRISEIWWWKVLEDQKRRRLKPGWPTSRIGNFPYHGLVKLQMFWGDQNLVLILHWTGIQHA